MSTKEKRKKTVNDIFNDIYLPKKLINKEYLHEKRLFMNRNNIL